MRLEKFYFQSYTKADNESALTHITGFKYSPVYSSSVLVTVLSNCFGFLRNEYVFK